MMMLWLFLILITKSAYAKKFENITCTDENYQKISGKERQFAIVTKCMKLYNRPAYDCFKKFFGIENSGSLYDLYALTCCAPKKGCEYEKCERTSMGEYIAKNKDDKDKKRLVEECVSQNVTIPPPRYKICQFNGLVCAEVEQPAILINPGSDKSNDNNITSGCLISSSSCLIVLSAALSMLARIQRLFILFLIVILMTQSAYGQNQITCSDDYYQNLVSREEQQHARRAMCMKLYNRPANDCSKKIFGIENSGSFYDIYALTCCAPKKGCEYQKCEQDAIEDFQKKNMNDKNLQGRFMECLQQNVKIPPPRFKICQYQGPACANVEQPAIFINPGSDILPEISPGSDISPEISPGSDSNPGSDKSNDNDITSGSLISSLSSSLSVLSISMLARIPRIFSLLLIVILISQSAYGQDQITTCSDEYYQETSEVMKNVSAKARCMKQFYKPAYDCFKEQFGIEHPGNYHDVYALSCCAPSKGCEYDKCETELWENEQASLLAKGDLFTLRKIEACLKSEEPIPPSRYKICPYQGPACANVVQPYVTISSGSLISSSSSYLIVLSATLAMLARIPRVCLLCLILIMMTQSAYGQENMMSCSEKRYQEEISITDKKNFTLRAKCTKLFNKPAYDCFKEHFGIEHPDNYHDYFALACCAPSKDCAYLKCYQTAADSFNAENRETNSGYLRQFEDCFLLDEKVPPSRYKICPYQGPACANVEKPFVTISSGSLVFSLSYLIVLSMMVSVIALS